MSEVHVVVGASGGTGRVLVRELHAAGKRVRAVNRSGRIATPPGVEVVAADATNPASMRAACSDAAVVYNCVNPPFLRWRDTFPAAVDGVLAGATAAGAVLVFADDTWMYGRVSGPMTEQTPYRPVSNNGVLRAWLADRVVAAHERGACRTVVGRAGELYGPAVESTLGANLFRAALRGRTVRWLGDPDLPLTPMFVEDFARGLILLGEREAAHGRVWHLPHADAVTGREFVDLISTAAGTRCRLRAHGTRSARILGVVSALARAGAEMLYQFEQPFVVDGSRFEQTFGSAPTPHSDAVQVTLDWYRATKGTYGLGR